MKGSLGGGGGAWLPCCVHSLRSLNTTRRGHKERASGGGEGDTIKGALPPPLLIAAVRPPAIKECHLSVAARRRHLFHRPPWRKCHRSVWRWGWAEGQVGGGTDFFGNFLSDAWEIKLLDVPKSSPPSGLDAALHSLLSSHHHGCTGTEGLDTGPHFFPQWPHQVLQGTIQYSSYKQRALQE